MIRFESGKLVKLREGANLYQVVNGHVAPALIKCRELVQVEDLGDGILCRYIDQEIWVAHFHAYMFVEVTRG